MSAILIIFAHPALEKSRIHRALLSAVRGAERITVHDLYEEYPDFDVDVAREQDLLLRHDIIVLQHPMYWYSCPALMKQWIDLVLTHGWAYGRNGTALAGKKLINAISTGGGEQAYAPDGLNRRSIREFLYPFEQTAALCRMEYLAPFVVHGSHRATGDGIAGHARTYVRILQSLRDGGSDTSYLRSAGSITDVSTHQGGEGPQ